MLTPTENLFIRILRGTFVATAGVALLVTFGALVYAGYAQYSPEPRAALHSEIYSLREAVNPVALIRELFDKDSKVYNDTETPDKVSYEFNNASDVALFAEFNKFLNAYLGASIESTKTFSEWLYGKNGIPFSWSGAIDDKNANNEDNVDRLWRSLLFDYAKRLQFRAASLKEARSLNSSSHPRIAAALEKLTAPTGRAHAPYFIVWFFDRLHTELAKADERLTSEKIERNALRLTVPASLIAASSAFGYFITVMFLFLLISIESSIRHMATNWPSSLGSTSIAHVSTKAKSEKSDSSA